MRRAETLPPSCADFLEIWVLNLGKLRACPGLYSGYFTLLLPMLEKDGEDQLDRSCEK